MHSGKLNPKQSARIIRDATYGFAFVVLPAFFLYGVNDLWNLPRWVLAVAFLCIAVPVASFQKGPKLQGGNPHGANLRLPGVVLLTGLGWIAWTLLSAKSTINSGDAIYLMGIRLTGLGFVFWLSLQREVDRIVPALVGLGLVEAVIGAGELLSLVRMNELMHVPIGTVGNNNIYGCLMALLLPFPLLLLGQISGKSTSLAGPKEVQKPVLHAGLNVKQMRILLIGITIAIGLLAFVSSSKTAVLALSLSALILTALHLFKYKSNLLGNRRIRGMVVVLIPLLLIAVPIAWAWTGFNTGQLPTETVTGITERGMLWRETIDICQETPLTGCGPAGWKYKMLEKGITGYNSIYGLRIFTRPHNDFLWVAAESGIPAMFAYVALLTLLFYFSVKYAWRSSTQKTRTRYYLLAAGILIWIVISNLNFPLERVDHVIVFATYPALIFSRESIRWKFIDPVKKTIGLLATVLFSLLFLFSGNRYFQDRQLQAILTLRQQMESQKVLEKGKELGNRFFTVDYYSSTPILWYKAVALLETGKQREALAHFMLAYEVNPFHPHIVNNLASTYVMLGDYDQAEIYYREAMNRFRDFPDPYINLSRIMVARGDRNAAIELLNSYPDEVVSHKKTILQELELLKK